MPHVDRVDVAAKVRRAKRWAEQAKRTTDLYAETIDRLTRRGFWADEARVKPLDITTVKKWRERLANCASGIVIKGCADHGARLETYCCKVPFCPRHQRRLSARWVERARELWDELPNTSRASWKLITVALKHTGNVDVDADRVLEMRKSLVRWLRKHYGIRVASDGETKMRLDAFGAVEQGPGQGADGHVHMHLLAYCQLVPRVLIQQWLKRWATNRFADECNVDGCSHQADDRCADCKAARTKCTHGERCQASWYVDIRQVKCKSCHKTRRLCTHDKAKAALIEALKYSAAPVDPKDPPRQCEAATENQMDSAERVMRYFLAMYKRHRVETYGRCRPKKETKEGEVVDGVTDSEADRDTCSICKQKYWVLARGSRARSDTTYTWYQKAREGPP